MRKVWCVAWTEYCNAVRSRAFIIGLLALPVIICISVGLQYVGAKQRDISDRKFAMVDRSGELFSVVAAKVRERNARQVFERGEQGSGPQVRPAFIPERVEPGAKTDADLEAELSERVKRKELSGFIFVGTNLFETGTNVAPRFAWHAQSHTDNELADWLERTIAEEVRRVRFERAGVDRAVISRLTSVTPMRRLGLGSVDSATGKVVKAKEQNRIATMAVPVGFMVMLYMMVMSAAPGLLNTVLEEKMQKISEVLLSSVTPFQLMLGKLLGSVLLSFTLSALYMGSAVTLLLKAGMLGLIPPATFFWFVIFQVLALLMFGAIFSAVGAACSEIKDAQNLMFPVMMIVMLPYFAFMPVVQSPNSTFSVVFSLFPPATPMLMLMRISIPPGPPVWQIALGFVLTTAFTLGCVWAAGKIFRIGLLSQGQAPSFAKLVKWVLSK